MLTKKLKIFIFIVLITTSFVTTSHAKSFKNYTSLGSLFKEFNNATLHAETLPYSSFLIHENLEIFSRTPVEELLETEKCTINTDSEAAIFQLNFFSEALIGRATAEVENKAFYDLINSEKGYYFCSIYYDDEESFTEEYHFLSEDSLYHLYFEAKTER